MSVYELLHLLNSLEEEIKCKASQALYPFFRKRIINSIMHDTLDQLLCF